MEWFVFFAVLSPALYILFHIYWEYTYENRWRRIGMMLRTEKVTSAEPARLESPDREPIPFPILSQSEQEFSGHGMEDDHTRISTKHRRFSGK